MKSNLDSDDSVLDYAIHIKMYQLGNVSGLHRRRDYNFEDNFLSHILSCTLGV